MGETEARAPTRWGARRRIAVILAALAAVPLLVALVGLPIYVFPPVDEIAGADVAYVIGPPTRQRVALAEHFRDDGVVAGVLISVPPGGPQSAAELSACAEPRVTCATPTPMTTKGEADLLADYARAHPADRVIVITFAPHVVRTRFILEKCYDGEAIVVSAAQPLRFEEWVYQYAYQTAAFVKAAVTPCADDFGL